MTDASLNSNHGEKQIAAMTEAMELVLEALAPNGAGPRGELREFGHQLRSIVGDVAKRGPCDPHYLAQLALERLVEARSIRKHKGPSRAPAWSQMGYAANSSKLHPTGRPGLL